MTQNHSNDSNLGNTRRPGHDYRSECRYFITIKKRKTAPVFGHISGCVNAKYGDKDFPHTIPSAVGLTILRVLKNASMINPGTKVWQYALMPDHLHFIYSIEKPDDEHLGNKIRRLKTLISQRLKDQLHEGSQSIFDDNFNDQILWAHRNLQTVFDYIRDNPRRLLVRIQNPDFFRSVESRNIHGIDCRCYGNLQLLDNPFKMSVIVHRKDDAETFNRKKEFWSCCAANGGVLTGAFISEREREAMREALAVGGRFIMLTRDLLGERQKPREELFELCEQGRLLLLTPLSFPVAATGTAQNNALTRAECLFMNELAASLAGDSGITPS